MAARAEIVHPRIEAGSDAQAARLDIAAQFRRIAATLDHEFGNDIRSLCGGGTQAERHKGSRNEQRAEEGTHGGRPPVSKHT